MTLRRTWLGPLIVGGQGCSVTFVLDSSENMKVVLGLVKRLLIQTLQTKASTRDSMFNIMTFSRTVSCWSHHMLLCAPDTVYQSLSWIHAIGCSPGQADLLAALSTAFSDCGCHAVHLLCTDLTDHPETVPTALPALAAGRPVNVFYLRASGGHLGDSKTPDYLQRLTRATRGSCYTIPVGLNGELKEVIPLGVAENRQSSMSSVSTVSCCCWSISGFNPNAFSSPFGYSLCNTLDPGAADTLNVEFFPGCRVLARRQVDGFYYLGTIIEQVQALGCDGVWVVEFDHPVTGLGSGPSQRELVCSLDMVNHTRALTRSLVPGDAVLSPWEPDLRRHGPGRVMKVTTEGRDPSRDDSRVKVLMWNTCVPHLHTHLVLPISASHHDVIVKELHISASHHCHFGPCCCSCSPLCSLHHRFDTTNRFKQQASSSSFCEDEGGSKLPPAENLVSKGQRPPWRYWRRTGPEPQHRQPGGALWRITSHPASASLSVSRISSSTNHSSMFQALPGFRERRRNLGDVFLAQLQSSSHNNATTVYTEC